MLVALKKVWLSAIFSALVVFALSALDAEAQETWKDTTLSANSEVAAATQSYVAAAFGSWEQRCVMTANGSDPCQLYQLLKDADGNSVAEISLFDLPEGGQAAAGATFMAPLETLLTANLRIGIDAGTPKIYPFSYCTVNGCVAKVGFTAEELAVMQAGTEGMMTVVPAAAPKNTIAIKIALAGFTAGHQALVDAAAKIKN